jgi:hypothetical protein
MRDEEEKDSSSFPSSLISPPSSLIFCGNVSGFSSFYECAARPLNQRRVAHSLY